MFDPLHKWLGIPPAEQPPNDYRLLGITLYESDPEVIDGAADKQLAFLHGLANGEHSELAEKLSNDVSMARLRLLNPDKKAAYDQQLKTEESSAASANGLPAVQPPAGTPPTIPIAPNPAQPGGIWGQPIPGTGFPQNQTQPVPGAPGQPPYQNPVTAADPSAFQSQAYASSQQPSSPTGNVPPVATTPGPTIKTKISSAKTWAKKKRATAPWLFTILPGSIVLCALIGLIAIGKLRLDQNKMEAIGVPTQQAEWLAGNEDLPNSEVDDESPQSQSNESVATNTPSISTQPSPATPADSGNRPPNDDRQGMANADTQPAASRSNSSVSSGQPSSPERTNASPMTASTDSGTPQSDTPERMDFATYAANSSEIADTRPTLPAPEVITQKEAEVRDIFRDEFRKAGSSDQRLQVAKQMLAVADKTNDDPGGRYALQRIARDIYMGEHKYQMAFETVGTIVESFKDADEYALKLDAMKAVKSFTTTQASVYSSQALTMAEDALENGRPRIAASLCATLRTALGRRIPSRTGKVLVDLESDLKIAMDLREQYERAAMQLESNPDDAAALAVVGRYLCFGDNNWDEGLPYLAKSNDELLKKAATLELQYDSASNNDMEVAEAWYQAAKQSAGTLQKRRLFDHANRWYLSARTSAKGLAIIKIDRRLEELQKESPSRVTVSSGSGGNTGVVTLPKNMSPQKLRDESWNSPGSSRDHALVRENVITIGMGDQDDGTGEACAGIEFSGVTTIRVQGVASHGKMTSTDRSSKVGFVVDYRTQAGYSKRVFLSCATHRGKSFTSQPSWGRNTLPDEKRYVGARNAYEFDLKDWAPSNWDGTCWFSVYMQNAGPSRSLIATITWK